MSAATIDLNCDMGESYGAFTLGMDREVMGYITSANVACGWHAGDPMVMDATVRMAKEKGVAVGAHPAYPDLLGFGRRRMACSAVEVRNYIIYQVGALQAFCSAHGVRLQHVKPHGALYNTAVEDEETARGVVDAIAALNPNLCYVALAGEKGEVMTRLGRQAGLRVIYEAFPDRAYTPRGTLQPRSEPGAVIKDPALVIERALRMVLDKAVIAVDGSTIPLEAQTLCVHGDGPTAVDLTAGIRRALEAEGVALTPFGA